MRISVGALSEAKYSVDLVPGTFLQFLGNSIWLPFFCWGWNSPWLRLKPTSMCHDQGTDILACGVLGKGWSAPGPTGSIVESMPTTAAGVVTVATLRR